MKKVKVLYLDASFKPMNKWTGAGPELIGDDTARLLQATIDEQEIDGYELMDSKVINTVASPLTSGFMLFFKKVEDI